MVRGATKKPATAAPPPPPGLALPPPWSKGQGLLLLESSSCSLPRALLERAQGAASRICRAIHHDEALLPLVELNECFLHLNTSAQGQLLASSVWSHSLGGQLVRLCSTGDEAVTLLALDALNLFAIEPSTIRAISSSSRQKGGWGGCVQDKRKAGSAPIAESTKINVTKVATVGRMKKKKNTDETGTPQGIHVLLGIVTAGRGLEPRILLRACLRYLFAISLDTQVGVEALLEGGVGVRLCRALCRCLEDGLIGEPDRSLRISDLAADILLQLLRHPRGRMLLLTQTNPLNKDVVRGFELLASSSTSLQGKRGRENDAAYVRQLRSALERTDTTAINGAEEEEEEEGKKKKSENPLSSRV